MNNIYLCVAIFGLLSLVQSGYGLTCYKCSAAADDDCAKGRHSLPTTECASYENKCGTFEYDILAGSSKVIGTGYQRGCAADNGYCEFVAKGANVLLRGATEGNAGIEQKRCDLCDSDLCNSTWKFSGSLVLITGLISLTFLRLF